MAKDGSVSTWRENDEGMLDVTDVGNADLPILVAHQCNFADMIAYVQQVLIIADMIATGIA